MLVTLTCATCSKQFAVKPSKANQRWHCSLACARPAPVTLTCATCGKQFAVKPSKANQRRHCSLACARPAPVTLTCAACGKQFAVKPSQAGRQYCSRQCAGQATTADPLDVVVLLDAYAPENVADKLGISAGGLARSMRRQGRPDLARIFWRLDRAQRRATISAASAARRRADPERYRQQAADSRRRNRGRPSGHVTPPTINRRRIVA